MKRLTYVEQFATRTLSEDDWLKRA